LVYDGAVKIKLPSLVCSIAIVLGLTSPDAAQAAETPDVGVEHLQILAAIRTTLRQHPLMGVYTDQVKISQAALAASRSSFDHVLGSSFGKSRNISPLSANGKDTLTTEQVDLQLSMSRLLPWGTTLTPAATLSRVRSIYGGAPAALFGSDPTVSNSGTVSLALSQSLLKGDGLRGTAGAAQAAAIDVQSTRLNSQQLISGLVYNSIQTMWVLIASSKRLDIVQQSEVRSMQLLAETEVLVAADERPAADLQQLIASLSGTRARLLEAQSNRFSALQQYGLALGYRDGKAGSVTPPSLALPGEGTRAPSPPADLAPFLARALERRFDLMARRSQVVAAKVRYHSARRNVLPSLNLAVSAGYSGLANGEDSEAYFDPLQKNIKGFSGSAAVTLALPIENRAARSTLWSQTAAHHSAQIQREELERQVRASVAISVNALRSRISAMAAAADAVDAYEAAVAAERTRLREGMATIIDLVLTEERLTGSQLSLVEARLAVALGVLDLAYQTGSLPFDEEGVSSALAELLVTGSFDGTQ
jgi:outer membrane protein TolC